MKNVTDARLDRMLEGVQITNIPRRKRSRVWEIDFLRGVCVLLMILDHLSILLADYFGVTWYGYGFYANGVGDAFTRACYAWQASYAREVIHPLVLFIFFSISGISCTFSRSNTKRGLQLLGVALLYTLGSYIGQEVLGISGILVTFGVLDFLAVSILIYSLVNFLCRENDLAIILVSIAIIIVTVCLFFCYTAPESTPKFFAFLFPRKDIHGNKALFYSQSEVSPGDLFPLIPWLSFFFAGVVIAKVLYPVRLSLLPCLDHSWHKPVCFIGRHALLIYILHVVLLAVILAGISYLFITPGDFGI